MVLRKVTKAQLEIGGADTEIPTVTQLTRDIRSHLEQAFDQVVVQGEISGWNRAASGHTYFTLKDERAALSAVLWRSRSVSFPARDGMKVIARGRITLYEPRGQYQLDCHSLSPLGQGELQLAFEQLKARLLEEGLFDSSRKKPLPPFPKRIGVVTSRTGAAIRDIITTLARRMPSVEVVLRPALVQGYGAAEDIASAIEEFNRYGNVDLLIVGRGGGALEDLWAFNEERTARAIAASAIPIISAVGHEIDFTIADFTADVRAATPTAAAEIAVRDRADLAVNLKETEYYLFDAVQGMIDNRRRDITSLLRSRGFSRPIDMVRSAQQRLDDLSHRSGLAMRTLVGSETRRLEHLTAHLQALNPAHVLARGYAIVEHNGHVVSGIDAVEKGDVVEIRLHDGTRRAVIDE